MSKIIIVGNSSIVLKKEMGEKIDSFNTIVRCNAFVTDRYEKYIGKKTHIWAINGAFKNKKKKRNYRNFKEIWLYNKKALTMTLKEINHFFSGRMGNIDNEKKFKSKLRLIPIRKPKELVTLNVFSKIKDDLLEVYNSHKNNNKSFTTGMKAIILALTVHKNITIYGFSFGKEINKNNNFKHYFKNDKGNDIIKTHSHNLDLEHDFVELLVKKGFIDILE